MIFSFDFSIFFFLPLLADAGRSPRRNANAVDAGKKMFILLIVMTISCDEVRNRKRKKELYFKRMKEIKIVG